MVKKSMLKSDKKAYLQIDLMFAILIFLLIIFVVFTFFKNYTTSSQNKLLITNLEADSRDLCYLLINSPGEPSNWEINISTLNLMGLKSITSNSLSSSKINNLTSDNYLSILDKINSTGYIKINIVGLNTSTNYANFGSSGGYDSLSSKSVCYSNYNNEMVKVLVEVWK